MSIIRVICYPAHIIFVFLMSASVCFAQKNTDTTWIQTSSGCKVYNPHPVKNETITWTGPCVDGFAQGHGALTWYKKGKINQVYVGEMQRGLRYGRGRYDYGNGTTYEGLYEKDKRVEGKVYLRRDDGTVWYFYEGPLNDFNAHGHGTEVYYTTSGDTSSLYTGYFLDDKRNGEGLFIDYYRPVIIWFKGVFSDGKLEGEGERWETQNNERVTYYKGAFRGDRREGYGEETTGLNKYAGGWHEDEPDGYGVLTFNDTLVYEGTWKGGMMDGRGTRVYPDGSYYVGTLRKNERHGFGMLYWTTGAKYIGQFRGDLFSGWGCIQQDGFPVDMLSGSWERGKLISSKTFHEVSVELKKIYGDLYLEYLSDKVSDKK